MSKNSFSWEAYRKNPIVGIVRGFSMEKVLRILPVYIESGFHTIEITMNTEGVENIISTIAAKYPEINVGAGTVCNMSDLKRALNAGSQFIVTPIIDEEVIKHCVENKIPVFPGAYTPTEIYKAWSLGANAVKVFPASQLGVKYVKDVLGPLDQIKLLPTGGVSKDNIADFFALGCEGVGMGSSLFDKKLIAAQDWEGLGAHFKMIKNLTK